jgi:hypothetical protein
MLSKSSLADFRKCPRKLWLQEHQPDAATPGDTTTWRRARDGTIVGAKARERLGPDVLWPQAQGDQATSAAAALQQLAATPNTPAVEFPLVRDQLYARADALIPAATGYTLQETKSSTFPLKKDKLTTGKPDEHLIDDVAIQAWVYQSTGLPLANAELNLLDNQWRYPGNNDYTGLFRQLDVTTEAAERSKEVPTWLAAAESVLAGPMPDIHTGRQCEIPYPCQFKAHCTRLDPPGRAHPLDLLPGSAGKSLAGKLNRTHGYTSLLEPSPAELTGKDAPIYRRMQTAHRTGTAILEADAAVQLHSMPYPRYYFDFEGIDLPVPRWAGVRPYEQIPFQWSCHIEHADGRFEHREFLDLSGNDPSLPCIEAMLEAIPQDGNAPIYVYVMTYEKGRLEGLAERHPQYADAMNQFIARLVDLHPIVRDNYYHPDMKGSFSIKKVLPTIAPELAYENLNGVSGGTEAGVAYLYAAFEPGMTAAKQEELRKNLLAYCKQDTWAMVEVTYCLLRNPRPTPTD